MPLQDRDKQTESNFLRGVNLADPDIRLQLGQFTSLVNFVPGLIYSLQKKRGVVLFTGSGTPVLLAQESGSLILQETGSRIVLE